MASHRNLPGGAIDTLAPSICCCVWCTEHGRFQTHQVQRSKSFHRDLVDSYDAWLRDLRALCAETRTKRTTHALRFLTFLGSRADKKSLARLRVQEIDAYVRHCCNGLGRASIEDRTVCLRDFLRHLHRRGCTASDLSGTVIGPRIYDHEGIPSALGAHEVQKVLEVTGADLSPTGLRDYAILMLLAT